MSDFKICPKCKHKSLIKTPSIRLIQLDVQIGEEYRYNCLHCGYESEVTQSSVGFEHNINLIKQRNIFINIISINIIILIIILIITKVK